MRSRTEKKIHPKKEKMREFYYFISEMELEFKSKTKTNLKI